MGRGLALSFLLCVSEASGFTTRWAAASSRGRVVVKTFVTEVWLAQDLLDLAAASAGGTVGVMGTVLALEMKKKEVMKRSEVRRNLARTQMCQEIV